jgi:hypothetical protein
MATESAQKQVDRKVRKFDNDKVVAKFKARWTLAKQISSDWRKEGRMLYDLRAGRQWDPEDEIRLQEKYENAYPVTTFNLTNKYIDAVTGLQINNRQETKYYPRKEGDAGVDEFATGVAAWCNDQSEAEDEESDVFGDVALVGMGWVEHYLNDEEEPGEGWIAKERRDPLEMYWDTRARRRGLADRRWQCRIVPFDADAYEEKFGEEGESLEGASTWATDDVTPQVIPLNHDYGTSDQSGSNTSNIIYVADYQWYEVETSYMVSARMLDQQTGQEQEVTQTFDDRAEWFRVRKALQESNTPFEVDQVQKRRFYRAWIVGDTIKGPIRELKCGKFTYEAITGERDRNKNMWYGIGRVIKDPQCWLNKFYASILYTITVNAKGGLLAEEDVFEDEAKANASWADPSTITFTTEGAISGGKIMPKPAAPYPQGMDRLMEFTMGLLPLTSGMNPELMGLADRDQPGVLEAQRKQAAMAIIAWLFDAMRRYYKRSGKLMLEMIRCYMPENQLVRITGPQGMKYVRYFKDRMAHQYDVICDEAPMSVNMRERVWGVLIQLMPMVVQAGYKVPPDILDYMPLPQDLIRKWKETLQPSPQEQQKQQKIEQITEAQATAQVAKDQASAQASTAKAELDRAQAQQVQIESQLRVRSAPIEDALKRAQAMREAAAAGAAQAGGLGSA